MMSRISMLGIFATCSFLVACSGVHAFERGEALVTLRVVDEAEAPVVNAEVSCTAWWPESGQKLGQEYGQYTGTTDTNGIVHVAIVAFHDMRCRIRKDGYYETSFPYVLSGRAQPAIVNERWQPWGVTNTVVLKRIHKPISMYAKHVEVPVPVLNTSLGYDLEKGDWVNPHGMGIVSDFVFFVTGKYTDSFNRDLDMEVSFSNPHDGLQVFETPVHKEQPTGSELVSDHEAPLAGYEPQYIYVHRMRRQQGERLNVAPRWGQNAYFRVRTKVDDEGKIVEAHYGKLYGDMYCRFRGASEVLLRFSYYLNPTSNDHWVEFDPSQNLFGWTYQDRGQRSFSP